MAIQNFSYKPKTRTTESGTYYAGKNKADARYASELKRSTSPYTAQGIANRKAMAASAANPLATPAGQLTSLAEDAAVTAAESELQDELSTANALQAERTAQFANTQAAAARPPGGSIRRGTTTIGQASGAGLMRTNIEARRKAKMDAARAKAKLGSFETILNYAAR